MWKLFIILLASAPKRAALYGMRLKFVKRLLLLFKLQNMCRILHDWLKDASKFMPIIINRYDLHKSESNSLFHITHAIIVSNNALQWQFTIQILLSFSLCVQRYTQFILLVFCIDKRQVIGHDCLVICYYSRENWTWIKIDCC